MSYAEEIEAAVRDLEERKRDLDRRILESRESRIQRPAFTVDQLEARRTEALEQWSSTPQMDKIRGESEVERMARRELEATWNVDRPGAGWIQDRLRETYDLAVCDWLEGVELTKGEREAAAALTQVVARHVQQTIDHSPLLRRTPQAVLDAVWWSIRERSEVFQIANRTADAPLHLLEYLARHWAWLQFKRRAPALFNQQ